MPGPILVLALHHSQPAAAALTTGLSPAAAARVTVRRKVFGELSGAYRSAAARHVRSGDMVRALAEEAGPELDVSTFERVIAVSWSAGYGWVDTALEHGAKIDGWIALDSGYGKPHEGVIALARDAIAGRRLYSAIFTDIETRAAGYESTREYLDLVRAQAGDPAGLFMVEHRAANQTVLADAYRRVRVAQHAKNEGQAYAEADLDAAAAFWRGEHIAAYRRGPDMLAAAIAKLDALEVDAAAPVAQTA